MSPPDSPQSSPRISIVLATYNRAHFLPRAIESVLCQTFPDFELIIVDDGSTDNTEEVVQSYTDPRVEYRKVEHGERSRARNLGIALSRGKYIAFLDSDDWFMPAKLSLQVNSLESDPEAGMSLGGWLIKDEEGRVLHEMRPWEVVTTQPTLEEWLFKTTSTPITVVVRKDRLERVSGFDPRLNMSEDIELWMRLALDGCRVVWVKEPVGVVLAHKTNSLRNFPLVRDGRQAFLDKIFSLPGVIEKLGPMKGDVYSKFHLNLAWLAYESNLPQAGQQEILKAIQLNPALTDASGEALLQLMIDYAFYFLVADPVLFIEKAFAALPEPLHSLRKYRRQVLSRVWMALAWQANRSGNLRVMRKSVWSALAAQPRLIQDRGVRSILVKTILGQTVWSIARRKAGESKG